MLVNQLNSPMNSNDADQLEELMGNLNLGEQPSQLRVRALEDYRRLTYLAQQTPLLNDDLLYKLVLTKVHIFLSGTPTLMFPCVVFSFGNED